ncbi:MAG: polysaccharide biosynthesis tyrosine autokinase [Oscillospiraceae bacterium]|nr:polysaccharide biosynthesis tyrosine autokinase [Oscillospiraceae bacterium]
MNEQMEKNNGFLEVSMWRLVNEVLKKSWMVALAAIVSAVAVCLISAYVITPKYESSAMFYVNNNNFSLGDTSVSITSNDITASKSLVESYIVILDTRNSLNDVIDYAGVDRTYKEVREMLKAEAVNETEIFKVTVTSTDPEEAEKIADAISYILPKRISSIVEGTSAKIVDTAVMPVVPSAPNITTNTLLGFLLGFVIAVAVIVLRELMDVTVRTEEDLTTSCRHPILATVPNMAATGKGGYYYSGYGQHRQHKQPALEAHKQDVPLIGEKISFAAKEAYKLLRTKLQFSFTDDSDCRVIGVSSALAGEGKSLTSANLAYFLSQLDKKVILIDCDMRRPSLNEKLPIEKMPGLSNCLSGQSNVAELIQPCGIPGSEHAFSVIAAGRNPPNPIELLSSARMSKMLAALRKAYDYIILDLPPVAEVSDAMVVAQETDGMLLVVRQNYGNRVALSAAVREFEFVDAKLLGVVYNCTHDSANGYGYGKRYYKRYYRRYYHRYEGRYLEEKQAEQNHAESCMQNHDSK